MVYLDLILNLTLLVALTIVSGFIEKYHPHKTRTGLLMQGVLFGSAAIIGMLRPLDFGSGVIFDGRSVMISLCGLYFGPRAVAVAAVLAILCRIGLAGSGMIAGILTILSSAGLGLGARLRYQPERYPPSSGFLYAFGLIVHLAMMALMLTLPEGAGMRAVVQIGPPVLLLYPLATILAGKILTDQLLKQQTMDALRESEQRLQYILNGTAAGTWEWNVQTGETVFNERWAEIAGYRLVELEPVSIETWQRLAHPDDLKRSEQLLAQHFSGQRDHYRMESRMRHKDGHWVWVADRGQVFEWTPDGRPLRMAGTHLDITGRKEREKVLREHQEAYLSILTAAHDGFLVLDAQGKVVDANRTYLRQSGYDRDELMGLFIGDLDGQENPGQTAARIAEIVQAGSGLFETLHRRKDGTLWTVEVSCTYCSAQGGRFYGFVRDITKRKATEAALRDSEQRNRALLNAMPDILFQFDGNGVFLDYHAPPQVPLLLPPEQFLNRSVSEIFPGELAENTLACIAAARRDGMAPPFAYQLDIDGQTLHFESRMVVCGEERFLSVVRDITEQKRAQEALQEKNREMERFVYTVSHDLRSPLVTITSFLELLREDILSGDSETIDTDLRYMKASAVKMERLLDALLQLSRAGYASTRSEEVEFREIVDESVAAVKGALLEKNVEVEVAPQDFILRGDPLNLSQIWQNLIGNAVKYMGDQPAPKIEIGVLFAGDEKVFFVRDNGIGIDAGHLQKVFDMFEKLNGGSDGPGLGLALVKRIVESYRGRIWVESQGTGMGSCFKFTLPQALNEPERATE